MSETGSTAVWRHVDTIGKELSKEMFAGCDTLGKLWDEGARINSENDCMGTREVIESHMEPQPNGRKFQKLVLGEYRWLDYAEVDEHINDVASALITIGVKKGQHVAIYAETRMEWMVSAIACFKCGFPVVTVYPTLGD